MPCSACARKEAQLDAYGALGSPNDLPEDMPTWEAKVGSYRGSQYRCGPLALGPVSRSRSTG